MYWGFKSNKSRNGKGRMVLDNGIKYVGEWIDGQMKGEGELYFANGSLMYKGSFDNNMFHGYGELYSNNKEHVYQKQIDIYAISANIQTLSQIWIKLTSNFYNHLI